MFPTHLSLLSVALRTLASSSVALACGMARASVPPPEASSSGLGTLGFIFDMMRALLGG